MLTIRLSRVGKKKQPIYRFIVSEKSRDPWGRVLEIIGQYNPRTNPPTLLVKSERVKHWLSKGAQLSDTVNNLLVDHKIIEGVKRRIVKISQKKKAKISEASAKAASELKPEEKPAEAKPAEEPKQESVPTPENTQPLAEEKPATE